MRGHLADLKGKMVLEVGSGAGRFTDILLKHGAIVHSLDYSIAVDANRLNNGQHENLTLVQADIRRYPFQKLVMIMLFVWGLYSTHQTLRKALTVCGRW